MFNRTQEEIVSNWCLGDPCKVSIVCPTYNHENYIKDAIESFLSQETFFPFEVVIHDDASTDNTREIIEKYINMYPAIIKAVFQNENQYSKGGFKPTVCAASYTVGEFVALCEGDDYWVDNNKLQKQISAMELLPNVKVSFHAAYELENGNYNLISNHSDRNRIFQTDSVILNGGGFCPTASLVFKREVFDGLPEWFFNDAPVGDYYLQILASVASGCLFVPDVMSVYRKNVVDGWSFYNLSSCNSIRNSYDRLLVANNHCDEFLNFEYHKEFNLYRRGISLYLSKVYLKNGCFLMSIKSYCNFIINGLFRVS